MKKYVNETLELDPETLTKLKELAEEHNASIDEIVNEILTSYISKKVTIKEFKEILDRNDHNEISNYYIIMDKNEEPIASITPLK